MSLVRSSARRTLLDRSVVIPNPHCPRCAVWAISRRRCLVRLERLKSWTITWLPLVIAPKQRWWFAASRKITPKKCCCRKWRKLDFPSISFTSLLENRKATGHMDSLISRPNMPQPSSFVVSRSINGAERIHLSVLTLDMQLSKGSKQTLISFPSKRWPKVCPSVPRGSRIDDGKRQSDCFIAAICRVCSVGASMILHVEQTCVEWFRRQFYIVICCQVLKMYRGIFGE